MIKAVQDYYFTYKKPTIIFLLHLELECYRQDLIKSAFHMYVEDVQLIDDDKSDSILTNYFKILNDI